MGSHGLGEREDCGYQTEGDLEYFVTLFLQHQPYQVRSLTLCLLVYDYMTFAPYLYVPRELRAFSLWNAYLGRPPHA